MNSNNEFGISLFQQLSGHQKKAGSNMIISPLSISLSLTMTYNGAAGETKAAMEETLYLNDLSTLQINGAYSLLMKDSMRPIPR